MLQIIAVALTSLGLAAFMANRLYVLFTQKQITVKGITYSRQRKPVSYWLIAVMATFGLLVGSAIFVISASVLASGAASN
jgi:hypothetical protein